MKLLGFDCASVKKIVGDAIDILLIRAFVNKTQLNNNRTSEPPIENEDMVGSAT